MPMGRLCLAVSERMERELTDKYTTTHSGCSERMERELTDKYTTTHSG